MFLNDPSDVDPQIIKDEEKNFARVISSFARYNLSSILELQKKKKDFQALSEDDKALLPHFVEKLAKVENAIKKNYELFKQIIQVRDRETLAKMVKMPVSDVDMDKVKTTLKQIVRDWSLEGAAERESTYTVIVNNLLNAFSHVPEKERMNIKVLVPGAGLGRLTFDIVKLGFSCQGNEFSLHMLLTSNYLLNRISKPFQFEIYPWIHLHSNFRKDGDMLRAVKVPDVVISNIPEGADFSMVAGEFVEVYHVPSKKETWDAVVTCFFMDTAKNIIQYLRTIHHILKPGGVWINLGPLLYHFEGARDSSSIELSLEDFLNVAKEIGFQIAETKELETTYTGNPYSMLGYVYRSVSFVATRL